MRHIDFIPGKVSSPHVGDGKRVYNRCFPVEVDRELFFQLFPNMEATEVVLYMVLLQYETIKGEVQMPTLEYIKEIHLPKWTQDQFEETLASLRTITVNGQPLVRLGSTASEYPYC